MCSISAGRNCGNSRALFRLQSGTTPTDPYPSDTPGKCSCGQDRTSQHALLLLARPGVEFDGTQTPRITTFVRRAGLGFTQTLRDGIAGDVSEVDDLDVGRIASLTLDLDI